MNGPLYVFRTTNSRMPNSVICRGSKLINSLGGRDGAKEDDDDGDVIFAAARHSLGGEPL